MPVSAAAPPQQPQGILKQQSSFSSSQQQQSFSSSMSSSSATNGMTKMAAGNAFLSCPNARQIVNASSVKYKAPMPLAPLSTAPVPSMATVAPPSMGGGGIRSATLPGVRFPDFTSKAMSVPQPAAAGAYSPSSAAPAPQLGPGQNLIAPKRGTGELKQQTSGMRVPQCGACGGEIRCWRSTECHAWIVINVFTRVLFFRFC